ncbi:unnamed protein product [Callosobruchus maculatus]|uniref:Uncharacterized protein n=1 Tax=Callosobruchus maculatus TaxID=64391 RepID=A0A653CP79_CALMS|nr:unnamed protein product [Callosobruchus maculatus]
MLDTTQFPHINVRDLILCFEQKSVGDSNNYHRKRSKSIGVINENTTVRCDDLQTLKDVEEALAFTDSCMKNYFAYKKEKHVSFLEQLFNILTCAINIENETKKDREKKKHIISRTKKLLVFLHSKVPLPTPKKYEGANDISHNERSQDNDDVFITLKKGENLDVSVKELRSNFEVPNHANNKRQIIMSTPRVKTADNLHRAKEDSNNNDSLNSADESSIEKEHISVTKLKANFEPHQEIEPDIQSKKGEKETSPESPILIKSSSLNKREADSAYETDGSAYMVSVNKLKNLFEEKSERSSLLKVVDESPKYKINLEQNMPYTDENLAFHRLKRAHSGYYLDYVNMIKMANLCKSVDRVDFNQSDHSVNADISDDMENTRELDDMNESDKSGYMTADELDNVDEDGPYRRATVGEVNIEYKAATIEPVNKEEAVRTEDNGTDGRLQFKEIEIEELDDTEDSKVEDDLSQIEAQVIETDDNDEDVEDGKQEVNSRSVEDDIEIEELETEEPIYEADETEDEVHHGSAFIIGKFYS